MTDELLRGLAAQCANMAKTELRTRHRLSGVLAVYFEGEGLRRMRTIERMAQEYFGQAWLDSNQAKAAIFGVLRAGATGIVPHAIVIATVINDYEPTAAFEALPEDERQRILRDGRARSYPQYFVPHDALMAVAQSPERVCIYRQRLQGSLLIGKPDLMFGPQEGFNGRTKMFGGPPPPAEVTAAIEEWMREKSQQ